MTIRQALHRVDGQLKIANVKTEGSVAILRQPVSDGLISRAQRRPSCRLCSDVLPGQRGGDRDDVPISVIEIMRMRLTSPAFQRCIAVACPFTGEAVIADGLLWLAPDTCLSGEHATWPPLSPALPVWCATNCAIAPPL
jgi:hypothetical protein